MTPAQYNKCVDLYSNRVYRFIYSNLKDEDESQDVVQNAYEIMWKNVEKVEFEKARSYLFTVAYHNMIDGIRKRKRIVKLEHHHTYIADNNNFYTGTKELIDHHLDQLPEIQKSVLLLRDFEGYDYNEIGKITKLNESQVKVYIFRARKSLKEFIVKTENLI